MIKWVYILSRNFYST